MKSKTPLIDDILYYIMYKFQESCPLQTPEKLVDINVLLFLLKY